MNSRTWRRYLLLGLLATAAYPLLPDGTFKDSVYFNLFGAASVAAISIGVWRNRPRDRLPWLLFAGGQALFVAGDAAFSIYEHVVETTPFPSAADGLYLAGYPLLAVALLLVVRRRTPGHDWASLLDAAIVTLGLGTVSWAFLMAPYVHDPSLSLAALLISLTYPLADVLLLGVVVRLVFSPGARTASLLLVGLSLLSLLGADAVYGAFNVSSSYQAGNALDIGWMLSYVLFGAAALHPSMARICDRAREPGWRFPPWRLALVAGGLAAAPVALGVQDVRHAPLDAPVLSAAGLALIALGVLRLAGVIARHERSITRESVLRQAGIALVEATDRDAICTAGVRFALSLADREPGARATLALGPPERLSIVAAAGDQADRFEGLTLPALPQEMRVDLASRRLSKVPRAFLEEIGVAGEGEAIVSPLFVRDELHGVLSLRCDHSLSHELRDGLEALASQVALALEAAALTEDLHRRQSEERFRSLVQNSSDLITVVDPDTTIRYQTPSIESTLGYGPSELIGQKLAAILHPDDLQMALTFLAETTSSAEPQRARELRIRRRDGSYRNTEVVANNLLSDPSVGGVVLTARDVTERKELEQQLLRKAFHDGLTGLANRQLFSDRLHHVLARRRHDPVAVLFIDLDDFKTANDSLGHAAGDHLLIEAAARMRSAVRPEDTVARFGGDEFAILAEEIAAPSDATQLAERILGSLATPFVIQSKEVFCPASAGIAIGRPGEADAEQLLQAADLAMYESKRRGKSRYTVFEQGMYEAVVARLELKSELRRALERREMVVHYQPIIVLRTGRIVGVEALARWHHPTRGLVPPAEFIPVAEETGLIVPLGHWVLEEACQQIRAWQQRHPSKPPLWVSVNLSVRQLQSPDLIEDVTRALAESGLEPEDLVLEITESVIADDVESIVAQLGELKKTGVRLAVDDFGTGYSALSYLRRLPVDILKIDKQFVDDLDNSDSEQGHLAAAIVRLGRTLHLEVIAEGIEQPQQSKRLSELKCTLGQGYHYSPPLSSEDIEALLATEHQHDSAVA